MLGSISDMTLWRYLHDPYLNFPKPIYIKKRRYWQETEVISWLESQKQTSSRQPAA
jgi:predicted DNA-binding transcriptional regulator AlpA